MKGRNWRGRVRHRERGDLPGLPGIFRVADDSFVAADQDRPGLRVDEQGLESDGEVRLDERPALAVVDRADDAAIRTHGHPRAGSGLVHDGAQIRINVGVASWLPGAARIR